MIPVLLLATVLAAPADAADPTESAASAAVVIDVQGLTSAEGAVAWRLYDSAAAYDGEGEPVRQGRAEIGEDSSCTIAIEDLSPGEYGVSLYHDENGNGELDTGRMRRPVEPYGYSNNARGRFGPASWKAIRFELTAESASDRPLRIEIEVK